MSVVTLDCKACGAHNAPHRTRADSSTPRPSCVACQAAAARQWRRERWRRRKAYDTWRGIIRRCHDPKQGKRYGPAAAVPRYSEYGGRGIRVCKRWRDEDAGFARFLADMGPPPTPEHTLDRIRGSRGYSPTNCRWADKRTQDMNRRGVRMVRACCPKTGEVLELCLSEWGRRVGVDRTTIARRLDRGLTPDQAVAPVATRRPRIEEAPF